MAGAGQPWYMPISWPVGHVSTAIKKPENDEPGKPSASPYLDIVGHLTAMAAAVRSWSLAYICIYWLPTKCGLDSYPAFGPAKHFSFDWMSHILIRNVLATLVICGFWDWFLYFSPLQSKVEISIIPYFLLLSAPL